MGDVHHRLDLFFFLANHGKLSCTDSRAPLSTPKNLNSPILLLETLGKMSPSCFSIHIAQRPKLAQINPFSPLVTPLYTQSLTLPLSRHTSPCDKTSAPVSAYPSNIQPVARTFPIQRITGMALGIVPQPSSTRQRA